MKRFLFPLASALRIRKMQAEVEEMKLFRLTAELGDCQKQLNEIGIAARERPEALSNFGYITGPELVEIDSRSAFLKKEKIRILAREAELLHRITAAKGLIREATQRVELLETLQTKARKEWQITADKELQTLAEESHNSLQRRLSADDSKGTEVPLPSSREGIPRNYKPRFGRCPNSDTPSGNNGHR